MSGARVEETVSGGTYARVHADPGKSTARRGFRGGSAPRANTALRIGDGDGGVS